MQVNTFSTVQYQELLLSFIFDFIVFSFICLEASSGDNGDNDLIFFETRQHQREETLNFKTAVSLSIKKEKEMTKSSYDWVCKYNTQSFGH